MLGVEGEGVNNDHSRKSVMRKLLLERLNKRLADTVLLVESNQIQSASPCIITTHRISPLKLLPLLHTRIPPNRTNIDHPIPKLHKRAPLPRQLQSGNIPQTKVHKVLILVLTQPLDETARRQRFPQPERSQAVLRKAEVEHGCHGRGCGTELFLLLDEIGAADEADCAFVAEAREELEHFGGGMLERENEELAIA